MLVDHRLARRQIDHAAHIDRKHTNRVPHLLHTVNRLRYGRMLDGAANKVRALAKRFRHAENRKIIALRPASGKNHAAFLNAKLGGNRSAAFAHGSIHIDGRLIRAEALK